jgi:tetratricopeptide (TPR) repeat protein
LRKLNNYQEAIQCHSKAIELYPNFELAKKKRDIAKQKLAKK